MLLLDFHKPKALRSTVLSTIKNIQFFVTFFLLSYGASAQLTGRIVDGVDQSPLEYATAALYKQQDSTLVTGIITDEEGVFIIENTQGGHYYVEASFMGYQTAVKSNIEIKRRNEKKDLGAIPLSIGGQQLDEIVLKAERGRVINKIDRQVFDARTFQNAQGGSATDVLRNLPSVSIDGQGEISVRGSKGFSVLLNGRPIQGNASTLIGQLPANTIERVEFITAPSAKYDPEGKAGIINILTKKGAADGSFAQVNVRGGLPSIETYGNPVNHQRYGADATYNLRKDKWNISIGANYQRNDLGGRREGDVYIIANDVMTRLPSTGERSFDEINYSGRFTVDFIPDSTNTFTMGFYAGKRSKDRLADIVYYDNHAVSPVESGNRVYTFQYYNHNLRKRKGDFALGSFDYGHVFANNSKLTTSVLYEYTLLGGPTVNQNVGYPNTLTMYQDEYNTNDNPLHGVRYQLDYAWKPFSIGTLETGYQFRNLEHTGDFVYERLNNTTGSFELLPEFSSEVDLKRTIHSGYAQLSGKKEALEYNAGLRVEAVNRDFDLRDKSNTIDTTYVYNFTKLYPSASIQYTLPNEAKLKVAYSKRVERTTTFKMNPFPEREHSETLEQGDPTLRPEFIDLLELGISNDISGGHSFFATAYFRNVENVVNRVNTIYNDTILNRIYSNVGNSKSLGLELGAQINPTENWSNFIGANIYSYSIDGSFDNRPVQTDATIYSINANSTVRFWKTASAQFTFNYLSARNTAQGEDSQFYSPNLTLRKTFLDDRLVATLQWQNIDMGLLDTNEQRITTFRPNEFYTTTNYVYEVDMVLLNLSYTFKNGKNRSKFIDSEFGKREF